MGNWPGVTVERKEGVARAGGRNVCVVDLPGTYSLRAYSTDERIARDYIVREHPDVVVNVVDCSNLERNLYLSTQLLELGVPLVLAMNMWDTAAAQRTEIDVAMLEQMLGVRLAPTVGVRGEGTADLLAAATAAADDRAGELARRRQVDYGSEIEPHVQELEAEMVLAMLLEPSAGMRTLVEHRRHLACGLLEGDAHAAELMRELGSAAGTKIAEKAAELSAHIERTMGQACELLLAQRRYGFITGACAEAVRRPRARRNFRPATKSTRC